MPHGLCDAAARFDVGSNIGINYLKIAAPTAEFTSCLNCPAERLWVVNYEIEITLLKYISDKIFQLI